MAIAHVGLAHRAALLRSHHRMPLGPLELIDSASCVDHEEGSRSYISMETTPHRSLKRTPPPLNLHDIPRSKGVISSDEQMNLERTSLGSPYPFAIMGTPPAKRGAKPSSYRQPRQSPNDSFLRMSTSTMGPTETEGAPTSTWSYHSPPVPLIPARFSNDEGHAAKQSEMGERRRSSQGTFGNKSRRWSAVGSAASPSQPGHRSTMSSSEETNDKTIDSIRHRTRALSMSSASASTGDPAPLPAAEMTVLQKAARVFSKADGAIVAHSLQQSAHDQIRIASQREQSSPPTTGTPSTHGRYVDHESNLDSGVFDLRQWEVGRRAKARLSKLDHMLGEGAEAARFSSINEQAAMENLPQQHRPNNAQLQSRSTDQHLHPYPSDIVATASVSPSHTHLPQGDRVLHPDAVDSEPSLQPSFSESKKHLLSTTNHAPLSSQSKTKRSEVALPDLTARNDLSLDHRAALLRRARKLEQVLGEPLQSQDIQKHVVDASTLDRSYLTKVSNNDFFSRADSGQPSWAAPVCQPQVNPPEGTSGHARSGSKLARMARVALGLSSGVRKGGYQVFVDRETRVHESQTGSTLKRILQSGGDSPKSPLFNDSPDEIAQRTRRQRVAKLHRLLGAPIPPNLVGGDSTGESRRPSSVVMSRSPSAHREGGSYMLWGENPSGTESIGWRDRLRLDRRRSTSTPLIEEATSFMIFGEQDTGSLTSHEKAVIRKRAQKLGQVLGEKLPSDLLLSGSNDRRPMEDGDTANLKTPSSFEAYQQSLRGLLYLSEHEPARLDLLVDAVDDPAGSNDDVFSPTSVHRQPVGGPLFVDPQSRSARRKRTSKLSQFFGETGVDFTDPHALDERLGRHASAKGKVQARREVLDGILGEMWRGVQAEMNLGRIRQVEGDKLSEMLSILRRGRDGVHGWQEL